MDSLTQRVQNLPRELFDEIYQLTFTTVATRRIIDESYKPPHLLHVNRASRALFASSFYGSTDQFTVVGSQTMNEAKLINWISSLSHEHIDKLFKQSEIAFVLATFNGADGGVSFDEWMNGSRVAMGMFYTRLVRNVLRSGVDIVPQAFKLVIYFIEDGGQKTMEFITDENGIGTIRSKESSAADKLFAVTLL